jgi:chemotaxis protein MotB
MTSEEEPAPGVPVWFVTFADMMSLLLTFFIMLVSMSELKQEAPYRTVVDSFRRQFGRDLTLALTNRPTNTDLRTSGQVLERAVPNHIRMQVIRPGDDASVGGVIFFEELAYELTEQQKRDLQPIVEQIAGKPQRIEIRGHTGRQPVDPKSGVRDLWDLADRRCHSVRDFLVEQGIEPHRIRLGNAEANEPLYNGADVDRLRQNSRVEILMWDERAEDCDDSMNSSSPIVSGFRPIIR